MADEQHEGRRRRLRTARPWATGAGGCHHLAGQPSVSAVPGGPTDLERLAAEITSCRACPRLVAWREEVATTKRAAFRDQDYWGRPLPGFGDPHATIAVVGLAPAAHGANRTGRIFTGDRSGDWLFASMYRRGLANQPTSTSAGDGLRLHGAWVCSAVRCAPPANRPTLEERDRCAPFLVRELDLLPRVRVVVALGGFAYDAVARAFGVRRRPPFGHGVEADLGRAGIRVVCSYHPSQQNTFTGRLTEPMLDAVFARAVQLSRKT
ncbi:MAG: uracil-DNA glycosylase [Acidimicrobiales bacterium]